MNANISNMEYCILLGLPILIGVLLVALYVCRYLQIFRGKNQQGATPLTIAKSNLKQSFHGGVYYILAIVVVTLLVIFVATVWEPKSEVWATIEAFFYHHAVFASMLGTLIGLLITFAIVRPKLILKKAYFFITNDNKKKFSLCISNWGIFPVHDVQITLFWLRRPNKYSKHPNDYDFQKENKTMRLEVFRPEINTIDGLFSRSNTYSFHGDSLFEEDLKKRNGKNEEWLEFMGITREEAINGELYGDEILCVVRATHSLSGISKVYEWNINMHEVDGYDDIKKNVEIIQIENN